MSERAGEIIALVPSYNEVAHVAQVVSAALKYVPVVVIDDGSTDGSGPAAAAAGATVITHPINRGKGAALNTGFDHAIQRAVAAAITLDADGQHDPNEIPAFVEAYQAGMGDIIIGRRTFAQMPLVRKWANRTGTWLLSKAMGEPIPDNQSGYRLLSGAVLRTIRPAMRSNRFEAEVEILLRARMAGFRIGWVSIKTIYGDEVSHYRTVRDTLLFLRMAGRIWLARTFGGRFQ